jgi:hypothetical protein
MFAEAGIQSVVDFNNFKDLDSRFRGNDGVFPVATLSSRGEGKHIETDKKFPPPRWGEGEGGGDAFGNFYAKFRLI